MKILVFSDSHGNLSNMEAAVAAEKPDHLIHLGDVTRDARHLADSFPHIPLDYVSGNCDYAGEGPTQCIIMLGGLRLLLTHGHIYHVKLGIGAAVNAAREAGVDLLLFGHTHQALCTRYEPQLWVMNPGSIRGPGSPSYGVIEIEKGRALCHIMELNGER